MKHSFGITIGDGNGRFGVVGQGRGGTTIVATPMAVAQTGTLVNGSQRVKLTTKTLTQMADNYSAWIADGGAPIPGYFGHALTKDDQDMRDRGIDEPALLVLDVWMKGDLLMGKLEFMPWAWAKVWQDGAMPFRGLSIVMSENGKDLNGKNIGAVFGGVDIVPEPFLPVQIAAAKLKEFGLYEFDAGSNTSRSMYKSVAEEPDLRRVTFRMSRVKEDPVTEAEKMLIQELQQKVEKLGLDFAELQTEYSARTEEIATLTAAADEAKKILEKETEKVTSLQSEIANESKIAAGKEATEAIKFAIDKHLIKLKDVEGYDKTPEAALAAFDKLDMFKTPSAMVTFCKERMAEIDKANGPRRISAGTARYAQEGGGDGNDEEDDGQDEFLAVVEEIWVAQRKINPQAPYGDALLAAEKKKPEMYAKFAAKTDRKYV